MNLLLVPTSLNEAITLANLMSQSRTLPGFLQGNAADCLMVIEQATRWGMSPYGVAQSCSLVSNKIMYEGKLVLAVINARGNLKKRLDFQFTGMGDSRTVDVIGELKGENTPRSTSIVLRSVKTKNIQWTSQPDQQLVYSGARAWARRYAPELMLGVYSPEEFDEMQNLKSNSMEITESLLPPPPPLEQCCEKTAADIAAATAETLPQLYQDSANLIARIARENKDWLPLIHNLFNDRAKELGLS